VGSCRARAIGHLVITNTDVAETGLVIPEDAVSLVIHNPSYLTLLLRWEATAVDPADPRGGYDLALPGVSLASLLIPEGASQLSVAVMLPPVPTGYEAIIDTTGIDAVTIWATPNNQGVFVGPLNSAPMPTRSTGT
jgi:hypothetical protein